MYFSICSEYLVVPMSVEDMLMINFGGFGKGEDCKSLWRCAVFIWCIWSWMERNYEIFNDCFMTMEMLWDRIDFGHLYGAMLKGLLEVFS